MNDHQRDLIDKGIAYLAAGLSLVPIDGKTKQPYTRLLPQACAWPRENDDHGNARVKGIWQTFIHTRATEGEVRKWIEEGAQIALVGGRISGGLLIFDFDVPRFYDAWSDAVGGLAADLPMQRTGGGGNQVLVRCDDPAFWLDENGRERGNEKLAWIPDDSKREGRAIAIETRAARGYAVIAPSIHPSGNYYEMLHGSPEDIPVVSRAHATALLDAAILLDEAPFTRDQLAKAATAHTKSDRYRPQLNGQMSVIDIFNERVEVADELRRVGYIRQGSRWYLPGNGDRLRPGVVLRKEDKTSFHHDSEDPLGDGYHHTAFDVFCHFDHGGDCRAAVKAAAERLGLQREQVVREPAFVAGAACCPDCGKPLRPAKNGNGWRCIHDGALAFWWAGEGYTPPRTYTGSTPVRVDMDEQPTQERRRSWLNVEEIERIQDPTFLINDFLVVGEVTVVAGAGDSGKTFAVLDAAMRVSEHYGVMYVAGEDAPGIKLRRNAWLTFWKRPRSERFYLWPEALSLFEEASVRDFLEQVDGLGLRLIVLDTLSQCSRGADENSSRDMGIVMGNAQRIAHATGAAVLIIHHSTKDGNGFRGSSKIKFDTYGFFEVSKIDDTVEITPIRVKNASGIKPRYFRFVSVPIGSKESAVIAPAGKVLASKSLTDSQARILTTLALMTDSVGGAKTTDLAQGVSLSGNAFYKPLKALRDKDYIQNESPKHGAPLIITQMGRDALAAYTDNPDVANAASGEVPAVLFEVNTSLTITTPELLSDSNGSNSLTTTITLSPLYGESSGSSEEVVVEEGTAGPYLPDLPANGEVPMYGYFAFDIPADVPMGASDDAEPLFPESEDATATAVAREQLPSVLSESNGSNFWARVPRPRLAALQGQLRSINEKLQTEARAACERYGLDYDTARALAAQEVSTQ